MSRKRAHINLTTKLAAALMRVPQVDRHGRPVCDAGGRLLYALDYAEAKQMTAAQVLSLFDWDHDILHALGGCDEFWNLTPRFRPQHREKSRGDTSRVAKTKRVADKHSQHLARLADRGKAPAAAILAPQPRPQKKRRPKAVMPGARASKYKRHMNGRVSLR